MYEGRCMKASTCLRSFPRRLMVWLVLDRSRQAMGSADRRKRKCRKELKAAKRRKAMLADFPSVRRSLSFVHGRIQQYWGGFLESLQSAFHPVSRRSTCRLPIPPALNQQAVVPMHPNDTSSRRQGVGAVSCSVVHEDRYCSQPGCQSEPAPPGSDGGHGGQKSAFTRGYLKRSRPSQSSSLSATSNHPTEILCHTVPIRPASICTGNLEKSEVEAKVVVVEIGEVSDGGHHCVDETAREISEIARLQTQIQLLLEERSEGQKRFTELLHENERLKEEAAAHCNEQWECFKESEEQLVEARRAIIILRRNFQIKSDSERHCQNLNKDAQRRFHDLKSSTEGKLKQHLDTIQSLTAEVEELRKVVHEHESCPSKAPEVEKVPVELYNANCGSYVDEFGTPVHLHKALAAVKTTIARFQRNFAQSLKWSRDRYPASVLDLVYPAAFFARDTHVKYGVKALIYNVFFTGFENESFNTLCGTTLFLDPATRCAKFYEYYQQMLEAELLSSRKDPQFQEFCTMMLTALGKAFNLGWESNKQQEEIDCTRLSEGPGPQLASDVDLQSNGTEISFTCLEELGGPQLISSFIAVSKSVWLLHKLAYSFEPPAAIFRVGTGADVDPNYMEPVVSLEDNKMFISKVGIMIAPGLRLRKTVLRSEVYLAGANHDQ